MDIAKGSQEAAAYREGKSPRGLVCTPVVFPRNDSQALSGTRDFKFRTRPVSCLWQPNFMPRPLPTDLFSKSCSLPPLLSPPSLCFPSPPLHFHLPLRKPDNPSSKILKKSPGKEGGRTRGGEGKNRFASLVLPNSRVLLRGKFLFPPGGDGQEGSGGGEGDGARKKEVETQQEMLNASLFLSPAPFPFCSLHPSLLFLLLPPPFFFAFSASTSPG